MKLSAIHNTVCRYVTYNPWNYSFLMVIAGIVKIIDLYICKQMLALLGYKNRKK